MPTAPSSTVDGAVAALGATLLVVLLATWSASIGPDDVFRGEGPAWFDEAEEPLPPRADPSTPGQRGETPDRERDDPPGWLTPVAALGQVATIAMVLYLAYRFLRWAGRLRRERHRGRQRGPGFPFEVLDRPQLVAEAIVSDAFLQRTLLLEGAPRNAVVACWHRFETQASSVGLAREPWETSSEFTLRMLDLVSAEPQAVSELATLYREARFSDHELGEVARGRAVAALDSLHRQLRGRWHVTGAQR